MANVVVSEKIPTAGRKCGECGIAIIENYLEDHPCITGYPAEYDNCYVYKVQSNQPQVADIGGNQQPVVVIDNSSSQQRPVVLVDKGPSHRKSTIKVLHWTDPMIRLLLSSYKENFAKYNKGLVINKNEVFKLVANDLNQKPYEYDVSHEQCKNKIKSLENTYKKQVDNNNKTGRTRATILYEKELEDIFGKRHHIAPKELIGPNWSKSSEEANVDKILQANFQTYEDFNNKTKEKEKEIENNEKEINKNDNETAVEKGKKNRKRFNINLTVSEKDAKEKRHQENMEKKVKY